MQGTTSKVVDQFVWIHAGRHLLFTCTCNTSNKTRHSHNDAHVYTNDICKSLLFFSGIGGPVFINENGDRQTDFTLLDLDPNTGKFEVYIGNIQYFATLVSYLPSCFNTLPVYRPNNQVIDIQ